MLGKITGNKMILGAVVGIVGGLVVAVLLVVVLGMGSSSAPPPAEAAAGGKGEKQAAPAAKATAKGGGKGADYSSAKFGPTYVIKDRIVNLADPGGRRYLRFSIAIEFAPHGTPTALNAPAVREGGFQLVIYLDEAEPAAFQPVAAGAKDPDKAFQAEIKKYVPAIEDAVTTVLSSKTYDEIRTAEGKDAVKKEIKARVQALLGDHEHVTNVYFTDFVVQ